MISRHPVAHLNRKIIIVTIKVGSSRKKIARVRTSALEGRAMKINTYRSTQTMSARCTAAYSIPTNIQLVTLIIYNVYQRQYWRCTNGQMFYWIAMRTYYWQLIRRQLTPWTTIRLTCTFIRFAHDCMTCVPIGYTTRARRIYRNCIETNTFKRRSKSRLQKSNVRNNNSTTRKT